IQSCAEGGYNIGWTRAGEWLNYSVYVPSAGTYRVSVRVASVGGGQIHLEFNGADATGAMAVPDTGDWQAWTTGSATVNLDAGYQEMRLVWDTSSVNANYIIVDGGASSGLSVASVPGLIEAEAFDGGPNGTAYYDSTPGNSGGRYRTSDVDIEDSSAGG